MDRKGADCDSVDRAGGSGNVDVASEFRFPFYT